MLDENIFYGVTSSFDEQIKKYVNSDNENETKPILDYIKLWFGDPKGLDIKINKIKYEESDNKEGGINYEEYGMYMSKGKEVFKIEYHPITIIYIFFNEVYDA